MNDFILGPQVPIGDNYFDQTFLAKARQYGEACPATPPTDREALNSFELLNYYDLPLVLYIAHRRTGDSTFLDLARKCADSWWLHPNWIGGGSIRLWPDNASPPPRHAGIAGLLCRALDGRPEMWEWIRPYVEYFFHIYVGRNIGRPLTGVREEAFVFHYMTLLAKVLPDSVPNAAALRAQYLANVENAAEHFFGDNQRPDGAWTWSDPNFTDTDGGTLLNIMQPFMIGLLTIALVDAHQIVQSEAAKESIKNQILSACRHLYSDGPYVKDEIEQRSGKRIRGFHYFYHGGTTVNPTRYERGDMKFPWTAVEAWWLPSARQAISTILPAFGYAYKLSSDPFFKDAGDELWDSAYSGRDGVRAMMDDTAKNFNQHARRGGSYRAWLGSEIVVPPPLPTPAPSPAPPSPTPAPQPAPPPAPAPPTPVTISIITPPDGATVSGRITVTTSVTNPTGITEAYLIVDDVVAAGAKGAPMGFSFDTTSLSDGVHSLYVRAWLGSVPVDSKAVRVIVKNAVEPVPQPPPVPEPSPAPVPQPTPAPSPTPPPAPIPCEMNLSAPAIPAWSSGTLTVKISLPATQTFTLTATSDSGQVIVMPTTQTFREVSSVTAQFKLQVKKKSGNVIVNGPCGSKSIVINVR